ncbi:MAG: type 4a pilus biogenesis protein PilO [Candidatus Omnitrophota bacterium]
MFTDSLRQWYNGRVKDLNSKQRRLLVYLAAFLLCLFYFGLFFKPNLDKAAKLKKENRQAKERLESLIAQFPDPEEARKQLRENYANIEEIKSRAKEVEAKLLGISSIPKLVKELISSAQGKKIDFLSVKQQIQEEKNGYSRLDVELEFDSRYEDMLVYLAGIERISPFVKIEGIEVAQSQADPANLVTTSLKMAAIISPDSRLQGELSEGASAAGDARKIDLKRSPLTPSITIGKAKKKKELKLSGITFKKGGAGSSVIINDSVVKEGDEVAGWKVEKIMADSVTIGDGTESENLTVER